jgi:hypothetical protein
MKNIIAMSLLSLATLASAQTAQTTPATKPQAVLGTDPAPRTLFPPAPTPTPKPALALDATEIISVKAVVQEYNNADTDIKNVEKAIQSHHPGYTFNFQTGQLVEIPKESEPVKAEDKK